MGIPTFDPPADVTLGDPFWSAVESGELRVARCSGCRRWQWYPDEAGPCCPGSEYEWVRVDGTGSVYSLTRVHRSFLPGGGEATPYLVGLIELDGVHGVRMIGNLDDSDTWKIGDRAKVTFVENGARQHPVFVHAADDEAMTSHGA